MGRNFSPFGAQVNGWRALPPEAGAFRPERFARRAIDPFELIPRGGGDHHSQHRCAGEWITVERMKQAARFLAREIRYHVPPQDLRIRMNRIPARPESGFVTTEVRRAD